MQISSFPAVVSKLVHRARPIRYGLFIASQSIFQFAQSIIIIVKALLKKNCNCNFGKGFFYPSNEIFFKKKKPTLNSFLNFGYFALSEIFMMLKLQENP